MFIIMILRRYSQLILNLQYIKIIKFIWILVIILILAKCWVTLVTCRSRSWFDWRHRVVAAVFDLYVLIRICLYFPGFVLFGCQLKCVGWNCVHKIPKYVIWSVNQSFDLEFICCHWIVILLSLYIYIYVFF